MVFEFWSIFSLCVTNLTVLVTVFSILVVDAKFRQIAVKICKWLADVKASKLSY